MPEGDTIFRAARAMNQALAGKKVKRFDSVLPKLTRIDEDVPLAGRTIESVNSAGKWNLIRFSGDLILLTHMRMNGSWHLYRPGERWQRPRSDMRIVIETADFVAVGFNVPVAEFHTEESLRTPAFAARLAATIPLRSSGSMAAADCLAGRAARPLKLRKTNSMPE